MRRKENQDRGRRSVLMRRITAAALACTMAFSAMPAAALSPLADEEGAQGAFAEESSSNEENLQVPPTPDANDVSDVDDDEGIVPEDGLTSDDPQEPGVRTPALEEGEVAPEGDSEADVEARAAEEGATDEWLRPAAGEAIPLTVSNASFKPAGSNASSYPVMQACTSHLLGLPTIIAYGTPLGGHDFAAEEGVAVSSIVSGAIVEQGEGQYAYWKTNLLDVAAGECQTLDTNANSTGAGITVSRIRYNARAASWEALPQGANMAWMAIEVGAHAQQLVFYYQKTADLDENVSLSNDNHYLKPEEWCTSSWANGRKDSVCLLYQLYDESGAIIANIPATEAYYYSHANAQEVTVSLSERLTGKYEIAKVSWDAYQEYVCYGKTYHQTCPDFQIPERFESLSNPEAERTFTLDLPRTACMSYAEATAHVEHPMHGGSAQTAAQSCTQYHQGLFVVGIMVRALPSDHGITVRYWGGQPDDAVELGDISLRVAGSDPYDWSASGYETADAIEVVTDLPYQGQNVTQEVDLGLPIAYEGCYADEPSARILNGNVLDLYFSPLPLAAMVSSDPVCKVYDGRPLAPAPAQVVLPEGFECVLDPGAIVGERTHAGVTVPELDWSRVHVYKKGQSADVKTAFSFEVELGIVEVTPRRIELVAEDAAKTYGETDPAFLAPEAKLLSPDDGFPAIIEGDDLDLRTVRDGDDEDVRISEHGNVVAYREVLDPVWNATSDYEVTATPAHFTIRPARVVIYVQDAEKVAGQSDEDEAAGRVFGGIIEGLLGDDELGTITYVRTNAEVEDAGVYPDVLTAEVEDENRNYVYTVVNGTFTITDATETPEIPGTPGVTDPEGPGQAEDPEDPAGPEDPQGNAVVLIDVDGIPAGDANDHDGDGWKKTYDGHEMQANAVAEKPGSTLLYAVDQPEGWTEINPSFTQVGAHTVYIKATNPAYADTDPIAVDMTIVPRLVTIRAFDASKEYGETDPEFSGEVKNLVRKDDLGQITYHRTNDAEEVGTYPQVIDAAYQSNPNYEVVVSLGTMDISPNNVIVEGVTGAGSFIEDAMTPLTSRFDPHDHSCWIHWWMLLGILVTLICAAGSLLHRRKHIRALDGAEDEVRDRFENTPRA